MLFKNMFVYYFIYGYFRCKHACIFPAILMHQVMNPSYDKYILVYIYKCIRLRYHILFIDKRVVMDNRQRKYVYRKKRVVLITD